MAGSITDTMEIDLSVRFSVVLLPNLINISELDLNKILWNFVSKLKNYKRAIFIIGEEKHYSIVIFHEIPNEFRIGIC